MKSLRVMCFLPLFSLVTGLSFAEEPEAATVAEARSNRYYWFVQPGYQFDSEGASQPGTEPGKVESETVQEYVFMLNTGIGFPFQGSVLRGAIGYHLLMNWRQDSEHLDRYQRDPGNFDYFPLAPRYTNRKHRLVLQVVNEEDGLSFGLKGYAEFERYGSDIAKGPKEERIPNTNVAQRYDWRPYGGFRYGDELQHQFKVGTIFRKNFSFLSQRETYQTYGSGGLANQSFDIEHQSYFDDVGTTVGFKGFSYSFTYNSQDQDFVRQGIKFSATNITKPFEFGARFASYRDMYDQDVPGSFDCKYGGMNSGVALCQREDQGALYGVHATYNLEGGHVFSVAFNHMATSNADFPIYDRSRSSLLLVYGFSEGPLTSLPRFQDIHGDEAHPQHTLENF